jgi:hypothetical protein
MQYKSDYNYTLLGCNRLLPIEQKWSEKSYRQCYKSDMIQQKGGSFISTTGAEEHEVNESLDMGEVGWGEGCMGCAEGLENKKSF